MDSSEPPSVSPHSSERHEASSPEAGDLDQPSAPEADDDLPDDESSTERGQERRAEDQHFVPVIIKRSDEARRHPDDILTLAIREGLEQLERRTLSLALSALAAGLILGFSAMAVAVVTTVASPLGVELVTRLLVALVYPLGFVVCIVSGAELFTEHTATAVYPVLDRRAPPGRLVRLWGVIVGGNLLGALASAALLSAADGVVGAREGYLEIGRHLVEFGSSELLASALLAGWLMALGAWLTLATPTGTSQALAIYGVTFLIGLGGLHHSIAGAVELFSAAMMGAPIGLGAGARFLGLALLGNLLGGSLFVAVLNYAHIRGSQEEAD